MTVASVNEITPGRPPSRRPLILHLSADYPDPVRAPTTLAVKNLIDRLDDCDHVIVSLQRVADPRRTYFKLCPPPAPNQRLIALGHFGLPFGIGLAATEAAVARRVAGCLAREAVKPDVIHAHKLAFEGIAAFLLARRLRVPYLVSVRGEADAKILRLKPTYRPLLRGIAENAHRVLLVSAWMGPRVAAIARIAPGQMRTFPNIITNVADRITPRAPRPAIVVAATLDRYRLKGIDRLIAAFGRVAPGMAGVTLEIFGSGRPETMAELRRQVGAAGVAGRVLFKGEVANRDFVAALPDYLAMALPSRAETFGMVYTEALFSGVPILYGLKTGIDGYLDGIDCGIGVDAEDVGEIARALVSLVEHNGRYRAAIAANAGELHRRFDPSRHLSLYKADIAALTGLSVA